jgi:hypothetical protein
MRLVDEKVIGMVASSNPLSGTLYQLIPGTTTVRVVGTDGKEGVFDETGRYLSGQRRSAEMTMCRWVVDGGRAAVLLGDGNIANAQINRTGTTQVQEEG